MRVRRIDEIAMDLVGDDDEIVLDDELADRLEFVAAIDVTARIMRAAQQQDARPVVDQRGQRVDSDVELRAHEGVVIRLDAHA